MTPSELKQVLTRLKESGLITAEPLKIYLIAQITHEANRSFCASIGDYSQKPWDEAPFWQVQSAINGVEFHRNNPDVGPEASHESWLKEKEKDGWKYGPVKNGELKEHPCFVPHDQLPPEQQFKDVLFSTIAKALLAVEWPKEEPA